MKSAKESQGTRRKTFRLGILLCLTAALLLALSLVPLSSHPAAASSISEYFSYSYTVQLSKSEIVKGETFYVTIQATATCTQSLPITPSEAQIISRVTATNQSSGVKVTLNPSYTVTINPFPGQKGQVTQSSQVLPLVFPDESEFGAYNVVGELDDAKIKIPILGWLSVKNYFPASQNIGSVTYVSGTTGGSPPPSGGSGTAPPLPTASQIEQMTTPQAVNVLVALDPHVAATILQQVTTSKAAEIIQQVATDKAADIIEDLTATKAADIIQQITVPKAADILQTAYAAKTGAIMNNLATARLTDVIPRMSESSLMASLPNMMADALHSVSPQVLLAALPNAPAEQLVNEIPPVPPASLAAPTVVYTTPTGTRYLAVKTVANSWVIIVGTPPPLTLLKIKVSDALPNIETTVEYLTNPAPSARLPGGEKAFSFFNITINNINAAQILVGHIAWRIDKNWLNDNNINGWSVYLSRYDESAGKWVKLPTTKKDESAEYVNYDAVTNAFSLFAITGQAAVLPEDFKSANLTITPTHANIGEKININADITNVLGTTDKFVASLWINSTIEGVRYLTLAKGQSASISFTVVPDKAGIFQVRIGRQFGSYEVTPAPKPLPSPATSAPTPAQPSASPPAPTTPSPVPPIPSLTPPPSPSSALPPVSPVPPPAGFPWWAVAVIGAVVAILAWLVTRVVRR